MQRAALFALVSLFLTEGAARGFGEGDGKRRVRQVRVDTGAQKFADTLVRRVAADLSMIPNPSEIDHWSVTTTNRPGAATSEQRLVRTRPSQLTGLFGGSGERKVQQALAQHFMEQVFGPGELRIGKQLKLGEGSFGFAHVLWAPRGQQTKRWRLITEVSYGLEGGGPGPQRELRSSLLWRTGTTLSEYDAKNPKVRAQAKANQKHIPQTRNDVQKYLGQELLMALQGEAGDPMGRVHETRVTTGGKQTWAVRPRSLWERLRRPSLLQALQQRFAAMDAQDAKLEQAGLQGQAYRAAIFQPIAKQSAASQRQVGGRFPSAAPANAKGGYEPLALEWTDGGQRHQLKVAGGRATYDVDPL